MSILTKEWINDIFEKLDTKLSCVAERRAGTIPGNVVGTIKTGKSYADMVKEDICWWTNGFWPGMMWLMYDMTKKDIYKETAQNAEELLDKAFESYEGLHHDVGFMWHISAGLSFRLTGSRKSYLRNIYAANILAGRYNLKGGYIRAWNGDDNRGYAIIDCMMNIPLLYWASKETDDERYKYIAMSHADKTLKYHLRDNGSLYHIVNYVPETGEVNEYLAGQGKSADSSWSRGQAWGLYGFTLSYIHTGEIRYLEAAKKISDYFISECSEDFLPRCDFCDKTEPAYYDASAGLIAVNGLIELSRAIGGTDGAKYYEAACKMLKAIGDNFTDWSEDDDAIITHCADRYSYGKHTSLIYADFFFAEAINKLKEVNTPLW